LRWVLYSFLLDDVSNVNKEPPDKRMSLIGKKNTKAKNVTWWTVLQKCQMICYIERIGLSMKAMETNRISRVKRFGYLLN
jgi:hypothetical protein